MPSKVYINIEDHRVIDNGRTVEDVTKIGLPTVEHSTTQLQNISGMSMDIDMPDLTHINAMDFTLYHNNGNNCKYLCQPGKHTIEVRAARQGFNTAKGVIEHKSVKYRIVGVHVSTDKGDLEKGSPYGSTEKYSVLRFEEIVEGKTTTLVDAMAGVIRYNGVSYNDVVQNMLK